MTTVQRIKNLAREQGISMTYLCKKIGLTSRTYFNDIEKHNREIPLDKLTIIASALNTTVDYLLEKENTPKPSKTALSPDKQKIVDMCDSLSAEDLQKVIEYTEFIISKKER